VITSLTVFHGNVWPNLWDSDAAMDNAVARPRRADRQPDAARVGVQLGVETPPLALPHADTVVRTASSAAVPSPVE
jgi:hypothetical protein